MTESNISSANRQFQLTPSPSVEKLPSSRLPNGRFAWPFPVARLQNGQEGDKGTIGGALGDAGSFVT